MAPIAFLCHASEDNDLARRIAESLYANGVSTFFDEWEIRSGDSIRQKIELGLRNCTHFLVLLTPRSIERPWVHAEIDAGFIKKVEGGCRFIPLRSDLPHSALSPLLKAVYSPEIHEADFDERMKVLIADIFDISRRPQLGPTPTLLNADLVRSTGLSHAALSIAQYFVRTSNDGNSGQNLPISQLRAHLELGRDDAIDGIDELEKIGAVWLLKVMSGTDDHHVGPEARLFALFDNYWRDWNPSVDALVIATRLLANPGHGVATSELAKELGWATRRFNPALSVLVDHLAINASGEKSHPEIRRWVQASDETRRFVRARS